ncbi:MAG: hypothetical protein ACTSRC_13860 [Candidatus Helarchaeota archaeon]
MVRRENNTIILDNGVPVESIPIEQSCPRCKKRLSSPQLCSDCRSPDYPFSVVLALGYYIPGWFNKSDRYVIPSQYRKYELENVTPKYRFSKLINDAKSRWRGTSIQEKQAIIEILCRGLAWKLTEDDSEIVQNIDIIVHVPKHNEDDPNSFNHGYFYAQYLSEALEIPFCNTCIIENEEYQDQFVDRFAISESAPSIEHNIIMIVDDVFTNGNTKGPISVLLQEQGASEIYIGVIGRTTRL